MTTLTAAKLKRILGSGDPANDFYDDAQAIWKAAQAEQRERDARICMTTGIKTAAQSGQEACAAAIRGQECS